MAGRERGSIKILAGKFPRDGDDDDQGRADHGGPPIIDEVDDDEGPTVLLLILPFPNSSQCRQSKIETLRRLSHRSI